MRVQAIVTFGVSSVNMAAGPMLSKAHAEGRTQDFTRLLIICAHLKLWPSVLVFTGLAVYGQHVLAFFGSHYTDNLRTLLIASAVPLVLALFGPTTLLMTILDLQRQGRLIFVIAFISLSISILVMGFIFGVDGVASAVLIVSIGWNYSINELIRGHAKLSSTPFLFWQRYDD